ncbi:hypothetical protein SAMN03159341_11894 [Paenibacillus sp. 1_12]|uniref:hypothetical protein n=1 Tax=Paenibacillus sp. 1_12 TaxID=1566278 RepID=UPI0008E478DF|nr:hypothetical protein [Paenibacillus sp. 1_12]SFM15804.1 hypothetical protein SAMN03159341_11894 [Paenibacillus sp. 1_12]
MSRDPMGTKQACGMRGSAEIHCDQKTLHVEAGDLLYIPPAVDYSQSIESEEIIVIHFDMHQI